MHWKFGIGRCISSHNAHQFVVHRSLLGRGCAMKQNIPQFLARDDMTYIQSTLCAVCPSLGWISEQEAKLTVSEIFSGECDAVIDLKRPLNKGQGHSFWYQ